MLSTFEQDIADLCHQESECFSAVRHNSSRADLAKNCNLDTENLLKVNSLIASQTDSIMTEAKSLLRGWIDDECVDVSIKIPPSEHLNDWTSKNEFTRRRVKADESLDNARNLLLDALPTLSEKRQAPKNLGLALKIRHGLAKERRSLQEDQKRLRNIQLATVISTVAARRLSQTDVKVIDSIAKDVATKELEELKADQAVLALKRAKAKEAVFAIEKANLEKKVEAAEKPKALKTKAIFLERGYIKAEQLYQGQIISVKKAVLKSLASELASTRKRVNSFMLKYSWSLLNRYWKTWKGGLRVIQETREYNLMVIEVRNDQLKMATSVRHHRFHMLSKAVLAWKQWVNLNSNFTFILF
jgi:hypothetical protein